MFKTKEPVSVNKFTFRKYIIWSLRIQVIYVSIILFLTSLLEKPEELKISFILLLLGYCLISFSFFNSNYYRGRFKDIFPAHNLSQLYLFVIFFIPPLFIFLTAYLCMKDSWDESTPPKIFYKTRYAFLGLIPFLVIQIIFPRMAYWTALPSTYYLARAARDSGNLILYKDQVSPQTQFVSDYKNRFGSRLSSTEVILLTAVSAATILKSKPAKESIHYNKEWLDFHYTFLFQMNDLLKESENNRPSFFDYSPMQWILPSGPVEIMLLSVVEMHLLSNFSGAIAEKSRPGFQFSEKLIDRMPATEKVFYKKKFDCLKSEYFKSKSFQGLSKEGSVEKAIFPCNDERKN